jgi:RNA polymerase sigma factor (sigma-70 family)
MRRTPDRTQVSSEASEQSMLRLARIQAGDTATFAALFDEHSGSVYAFCVRRCHDRDLAEDLMSVVFLEAWRSRPRAVTVDDSLRPWLLGIATNVLRNSARSRRRHRAALDRYRAGHDGLVEPDLAAAVARRVDRPHSARVVEQALASLSVRERDVVDLCLVHELSIAAAATALGIPEGTVKSRLARGRHRMQRLLRTSDCSDPDTFIGHVRGEHQTGAPVGALRVTRSQT